MRRRVASFVLSAILFTGVFTVPVYAIGDDDGWFVDGIVSGLIEGLKDLFIPDADYFEDFREDIQNRFDKKTAGVTNAIGYLRERFSELKSYKDLNGIFTVIWPKNSFLSGIRANFLSLGAPILSFVRDCTTGLVAVLTAILCYRKVITLVNR